MLSSDDPGSAVGLLEDDPAPTPTAPEAPAAEPAPSESIGTSDVATDGQPRDEHGRFTNKTGDPAPLSTAPDVGSTSASAGPSDSNAVLDNRSPHPGTTQPSPAEPVQTQPLTFRAGGQALTYPGAERLPDGSVRIAPEAAPALLNDLAAARTYQTTWRNTLERTKQEAAQATQEATAKATTYEAIANRLFNDIQQHMDPREYELLAKELALDLRTNGIQPQSAMNPAQAPEQQQQEVEQLRFSAQKTLVDEVLTHLTHNPTYAKLAPDEATRNELLNDVLESLPAFYEEINGQVMLNRVKVERFLQRESRRITEVEKVRTEEAAKLTALQAAMDKNAANGKAPNLPPVVAGRGSPPPSEGTKTFKTRAEYDAWKQSYGLA